MLCKNPIYYVIRNGKKVFLDKNEQKLIKNGIFEHYINKNTKEKNKKNKLGQNFSPAPVKEPVHMLPCGKCIVCLSLKRDDWTLRCCLEEREYVSNMFITLTYNEENSPVCGVSKEELKRFIHNLREHFSRKYNHIGIRYYACGEYGQTTCRPHYHLIIFNCPRFNDEMFYKENDYGHKLYTSDTLNHLWGKGNCVIGSVTKHSIKYVTSYALKALFINVPPNYNKEFCLMSRKKGIGYDYLCKNLDQIIKDDRIYLTTKESYRLPRYFDRVIEEKIGTERFEKEILEPRNAKAKELLAKEMARTGQSEEEINETRMKVIIHRVENYIKGKNNDY